MPLRSAHVLRGVPREEGLFAAEREQVEGGRDLLAVQFISSTSCAELLFGPEGVPLMMASHASDVGGGEGVASVGRSAFLVNDRLQMTQGRAEPNGIRQ